jgi:putative endonuclease
MGLEIPSAKAPRCPGAFVFGSPRRSSYNPPVSEYFCYIIECADGTLYTGITNDPGRRLREHELGRGARYTRSRRPLHLAYVEEQPDLKTAMRRERAIKALSRERKLALIATQPMGEPAKYGRRGK